jgi:hypothetical protein
MDGGVRGFVGGMMFITGLQISWFDLIDPITGLQGGTV